MNTYDDEMFKYLTDLKNYRSAKQISDLLIMIDDRLRKDFQSAFSEKLKRENIFPFDFSEDDWSFYLKKQAWNDMSIGLDKGAYDIGICLKRASFNMEDVKQLANQNTETQSNLNSENEHWLCWRPIENIALFRFNTMDTLSKILPDYRDIVINELLGYYLTYAKKLETFCDEILKFHK